MGLSNRTVLAFLAALALCANTFAAVRFAITDLGTLGGPSSQAFDINGSGQIVGRAAYGNTYHGFLYSSGVMNDLGTLGQGTYSTAYAISANGVIVGETTISAFPQAGEYNHAMMFQNGHMTDLETVRQNWTWAVDANSTGQIVINRIVTTGPPAQQVSYLRQPSGLLNGIATFGGTSSYANALNEAGKVVGTASMPGDTAKHAFLWVSGSMTDLGTLGGGNSAAFAINNVGQIVGNSNPPGSQSLNGFLYENGKMLDLASLVPAGSGWQFNSPQAINDAGWIVGQGRRSDGTFHGFLLTPVPEAGTFLVPALFATVFLSRRARVATVTQLNVKPSARKKPTLAGGLCAFHNHRECVRRSSPLRRSPAS